VKQHLVCLVDYDPDWPKQFEREAARIRSVLGDRALRIEHVGSTSVDGLIAKPVIDVLLEVSDSGHELAYVPALEAAGYAFRLREPDWHEHRLLKRADPDVNLHVFSASSSEPTRMLVFRDRLRTSTEDRELYARTKRELAQHDWSSVQDYANAKTGVVEAILRRALRSLSPES
jgi:GrpB-like predicted nucleotidyltransferase (UPF0157 family)